MDKAPFVPFPTGTIRGPYTCGKGTDPEGGVQFLVRLKNGCWLPVIKARWEEAEARKEAEGISKKELADNAV